MADLSGIYVQLELLKQHRRRLRILLIQQAQKGISTPPEVLIEIEDISAQIEQIKILLQKQGIEAPNELEDVSSTTQPLDTPSFEAAWLRFATLPLDTVPPPATLPTHSRMPLSHSPTFTGRESTLMHLATLLKDTSVIVPVVAITGIGGIGKTQLAAEVVHRYGPFFADGVFWLDFSSADRARLEVVACGGHGGMQILGFERSSPDEQEAQVVQAWQQGVPRLLIFDNCEQEALLARWRPTTGGCRVLLTSRREQWDKTLVSQALSLSTLDRAESITLLRQFRPDIPADDEILHDIAAEVGNLPLALHLAGRYLQRYQHDLSHQEYLRQIRTPALLQHRSLEGWKLISDQMPTRHDPHVARTFAISYNQLMSLDLTDRVAIKLLACGAHFAPGIAIPRALLLATGTDEGNTAPLNLNLLDLVDALDKLHELGLLERHNQDAVRLHRLLAAFVKDVIDAPTDTAASRAVEQIILDVLLNQFQLSEQDKATLAPHLETVTTAMFERAIQRRDYHTAAFVQLLIDPYLMRWGAYQRIKERHERVQPHIADPETIVESSLYLSQAYAFLGNHRQAIALLTDALEIADDFDKPIYRAGLLGDLANLYMNVGLIDEAIPHIEAALALARASRSISLEAKWCANLGGCYYALGRVDTAMHQFIHARELIQTLPESDTVRDVITLCRNGLGTCLYSIGETNRAYSEYTQALTIARKQLDKAGEAAILGNIGNCHAGLGETELADQYLQEALAVCRALGNKHIEAHLIHSLTELLIDQAQLDGAIDYAKAGVTIAAILENPQLIGEHNTALAQAYLYSNKLDLAHEAIISALQTNDRLNQHYTLALAGVIALLQGRQSDAEGYFQAAIQRAEVLLSTTPQYYSAFDAQGLSYTGLAVMLGRDYSALAQAAYWQARSICSDQGIIGRGGRLVDVLTPLDQTGVLADIRPLLNQRSSLTNTHDQPSSA